MSKAKQFKYFGMCFRQRKKGVATVQFIAAAEDIKTWAGVPSKSATFMKGFQRALIESHQTEISQYFEIDEANTSPTSIVVAFKPETIKLTPLPEIAALLPEDCPAEPVLIEIDIPDNSAVATKTLAVRAASMLRASFKDLATSEEDDDSLQEDRDQTSELGNEENGNSGEDEEGDASEMPLSLGTSHLKTFLANLENPKWVEQMAQEDEVKLKTFLADILKPATIVDGQHRATGAAFLEKRIPFSVVGLVDAEWKEEVFQFVVINQRAEAIKPEFLSAIISSSLSKGDIEKLQSRLEQAGVDLLNTRLMDLLHEHASSPFRSMIDFKIKGDSGKLKYSGMLTLAKRFRRLTTHEPDKVKFGAFFKQSFWDVTPGALLRDKRAAWNDGEWFAYFEAFWNEVKLHLVTKDYANLWEPGSNLLKIVTLQELQNLFLAWCFTQRTMYSSKEEFLRGVKTWIKHLKGRFFTDNWELTSLQSDAGRGYLRKALEKALNSADYKYKDELFTGHK
jgi:hypothetical protein